MTSWNQGDTAKLATVVIAERDAPCAVPFGDMRGLALLRQQDDEDLEALGTRVIRLIDRTRTDKLVVQGAWFLVSADHDDRRFATRRRIARALGEAVRHSSGGGLTIVAPAELSAPTRAAALSLAGSVVEGEGAGDTTVHLRFVERRTGAAPDVGGEIPPPPKSGRRLTGRAEAANTWVRRTA